MCGKREKRAFVPVRARSRSDRAGLGPDGGNDIVAAKKLPVFSAEQARAGNGGHRRSLRPEKPKLGFVSLFDQGCGLAIKGFSPAGEPRRGRCCLAFETEEPTVTCLGCGGLMPSRRGIPVCSERCEKRERRARRRRERIGFCAVCDELFSGRRRDARYCGTACRQKSYPARKAAKDAAHRRAVDLAHALIG